MILTLVFVFFINFRLSTERNTDSSNCQNFRTTTRKAQKPASPWQVSGLMNVEGFTSIHCLTQIRLTSSKAYRRPSFFVVSLFTVLTIHIKTDKYECLITESCWFQKLHLRISLKCNGTQPLLTLYVVNLGLLFTFIRFWNLTPQKVRENKIVFIAIISAVNGLNQGFLII